jgi:hypothetical protein
MMKMEGGGGGVVSVPPAQAVHRCVKHHLPCIAATLKNQGNRRRERYVRDRSSKLTSHLIYGKGFRRPHCSVGDPDPHVLALRDPDPLVRGTDPAPSLFS